VSEHSHEGGGASRSTDPAAGSSAATDVSLREFVELDWRWQARFEAERDRRYNEVNIEREKALKIKETADLAALGLAREIQTYKDEKANELREQIGSERGLYVTRPEIKPLADYVTAQSGPRALTTTSIVAVLAAVGILGGLWFGSHQSSPPAVTVTIPAVP
jgi:hypothetical protein